MTFARYLGTPEETPYGYELSDWNGMLARIMNMDTHFSVKGLRHIGRLHLEEDGLTNSAVKFTHVQASRFLISRL